MDGSSFHRVIPTTQNPAVALLKAKKNEEGSADKKQRRQSITNKKPQGTQNCDSCEELQGREINKQSYDLGPKSIQSNNFIRFPELRNQSPQSNTIGAEKNTQLSQTIKRSYLAERMTGSSSFAAIPVKGGRDNSASAAHLTSTTNKHRQVIRLSNKAKKSNAGALSKTMVAVDEDQAMTVDDGALPGLATARLAL